MLVHRYFAHASRNALRSLRLQPVSLYSSASTSSSERSGRKFNPNTRRLPPSKHTGRPTNPITRKEKPAVIPSSPASIYRTLSDRIDAWAAEPHTERLFTLVGLSKQTLGGLLPRFRKGAKLELSKGRALGAEPSTRSGQGGPELNPLSVSEDHWDIDLVRDQLDSVRTQADLNEALDKLITSRFLAFALTTRLPSDPSPSTNKSRRLSSQYDNIVTHSPLSHLGGIRNVLDQRYPAERFSFTRTMRRKIIMHVGPTNSGKTHNALVALALAPTGVYAGPLRLLAHEVWNRLNRGLIALPPLVEGGPPRALPRPCNMITGEEVRIVMEDAPLCSVTVEMVSSSSTYDVAVLDEIQMISDPDRGDAWTAALLGLRAKEIHLCGEETAVDVVQRILKETDDELIVNRYERLTPLNISEKSLEGSIKNVKRGDCVVVFSRSGIFEVKRMIEASTGLKCAVAYGGLPPEVRSEQAHLFNDPNSGYDVMVASDAVGMGINLKIKRIVFESLEKWDGFKTISLSTSQIKQIAGRAGRFGLHADEGAGQATTLHAEDLPKLRKAFGAVTPTISRAVIAPTEAMYTKLATLLPRGTSFKLIHEMIQRHSLVREPYSLSNESWRDALSVDVLERHGQTLSLTNALTILRAPINFKLPALAPIGVNLVKAFATRAQVTVADILAGTPSEKALEKVLKAQESAPHLDEAQRSDMLRELKKDLPNLEGLHRGLTVYLWFSFRVPPAFSEQNEAFAMKQQTEKAIEWVLSTLSDTIRKRQLGRRGRSDK